MVDKDDVMGCKEGEVSSLRTILCETEKIKGILSNEFMEFKTFVTQQGEKSGFSPENGKFRIVFYSSVQNKGMLPAFVPEQFYYRAPGGEYICKKVLIAVSDQDFSDRECEMLLNRQLIH